MKAIKTEQVNNTAIKPVFSINEIAQNPDMLFKRKQLTIIALPIILDSAAQNKSPFDGALEKFDRILGNLQGSVSKMKSNDQNFDVILNFGIPVAHVFSGDNAQKTTLEPAKAQGDAKQVELPVVEIKTEKKVEKVKPEMPDVVSKHAKPARMLEGDETAWQTKFFCSLLIRDMHPNISQNKFDDAVISALGKTAEFIADARKQVGEGSFFDGNGKLKDERAFLVALTNAVSKAVEAELPAVQPVVEKK